MGRQSVCNLFNFCRMFFDEFHKYRVGFIIDKAAAGLNLVYKNFELLQIRIKSWKHVDMVPGYSGEDSHMRKQEMKFGSLFQNTCRVFIAFANDQRCISDADRLIKSFQSCTNQVIEFLPGFLQYMHNHGGSRSLTM